MVVFPSVDPARVDLFGTEGDDIITGSSGRDAIRAGAGDDIVHESSGRDALDGGPGFDIFVTTLRYAERDYVDFDGTFVLLGQDWAPDYLINVERIVFRDGVLAFDVDGAAGQAYRLYRAAFDRRPDADGLGHWIRKFDAGASDVVGAAAAFIGSDEFAGIYGAPEALSDPRFVDLLYSNVLRRDGDEAGTAFWIAQLEAGLSRAEALAAFSESPENVAATAAPQGIWFV